jgi:hypothetical protein
METELGDEIVEQGNTTRTSRQGKRGAGCQAASGPMLSPGIIASHSLRLVLQGSANGLFPSTDRGHEVDLGIAAHRLPKALEADLAVH